MSCLVAVRSQSNTAHVQRLPANALVPNPSLMMTPSGRSDPQTNTTGEPTLPSITITDATPQRTPDARPLANLSTPTSALAHTPASSAKGTDTPYRLLYRGALSLPDSYLQLDGIAFSARLPNRQSSTLQDSPSCSLSRSDASARELMYNPLALALESMRGRQSLRFKGTVRLQDVWMDDSGEVYMCVSGLLLFGVGEETADCVLGTCIRLRR